MHTLVSRKKTMAPYGRNASCRGTLPRGKHFSKKNLALLGALCHADKQHRAAITRTADKPLVKCICECVLNVSHGTNINTHCASYRAQVEMSIGALKRVIIQNGGSFLPILLAPLVSTLISKIFGSSDTR